MIVHHRKQILLVLLIHLLGCNRIQSILLGCHRNLQQQFWVLFFQIVINTGNDSVTVGSNIPLSSIFCYFPALVESRPPGHFMNKFDIYNLLLYLILYHKKRAEISTDIFAVLLFVLQEFDNNYILLGYHWVQLFETSRDYLVPIQHI